ncbi:MAG: 2-amino-4-hydroxy-6-hydroxymethyldihydropteridine diphosphokinase [Lachnospiraceae bacterium]|nr:2-amino-4-hydroxy-6-hydroxymethyldihydropteridine diphosphokinase [Lachnospiraceae bacterium]
MYNELGSDEIRIEGLEVYAYHGVYPEEREKGQTFYVNATLYTDTHKAGLEDKLELSTNYGDVCLFINQWMKGNTYQLLETVAEKLSKAILLKYNLISSVDLEIRKPEAPIELPFGCVSVKVHRGWHKVYLALGSNMGDKEDYINGAIHALKEHPQIKVNKISDMIVTKPYGGVKQDDFLNGALEAETLLSPEELLEACHDIEDAANRRRTIHWGPRTLDIDILFYDKLIFESDTLVIPHPDLENRDFVLKPMNMLAPNFRHPVLKKTMAQLLQEL